MKTYKLHAGVSAHSCAKHARYNRAPHMVEKIAAAGRHRAKAALWAAATKEVTL